MDFAKELDVFSIQVSLAAPYPGTELYEMARQNGWFTNKDKTDIVQDDGFQQSSLEYPGLSKDKIRGRGPFLSGYYLRPETDYCASSKRCWRTRMSSSAAAARATNFSRACASAKSTARRGLCRRKGFAF